MTSHVIDAEAYSGTTLVRPDGVVAWRSRGPASRDDVERALATALAR